MLEFLLGIIIGGVIGVLITALCVAASEGERR